MSHWFSLHPISFCIKMAQQTSIDNFLVKKKINASTKAFARQHAEISSKNEKEKENHSTDFQKHIDEMENLKKSKILLNQENEKYKNQVEVLEHQLKLMTTKYESLKVNHVQLLQTLFHKETQNQRLSSKVDRAIIQNQAIDSTEIQPNQTDEPAEKVNSIFIK